MQAKQRHQPDGFSASRWKIMKRPWTQSRRRPHQRCELAPVSPSGWQGTWHRPWSAAEACHNRGQNVQWRALQVWQAGVDGVQDGEALQYDPTAYSCLHQLTFEWPCLRQAAPRASIFPGRLSSETLMRELVCLMSEVEPPGSAASCRWRSGSAHPRFLGLDFQAGWYCRCLLWPGAAST